MRALATCITKAGKTISSVEAKMLKSIADKYRAEGFSPHESNMGAISEVIAELEDDAQSIIAQVKATVATVVERSIPDGPVDTVVVDKQPLIDTVFTQNVFDALAQASSATSLFSSTQVVANPPPDQTDVNQVYRSVDPVATPPAAPVIVPPPSINPAYDEAAKACLEATNALSAAFALLAPFIQKATTASVSTNTPNP